LSTKQGFNEQSLNFLSSFISKAVNIEMCAKSYAERILLLLFFCAIIDKNEKGASNAFLSECNLLK